MAATKSSTLDMTQGNPGKLIFRFSLPLIAGNALQQLYNMVDSIVVGQFVGKTALAAVGVAFPVIFLLSSIFMGLGAGAMILVSQFYGGGERENLRKTIDTVYTALIVGSIPLTLIGILFTNPILDLLNVPADARPEAYIYLVIVMSGLIGSLGYNSNAGILQGIGDSKTPLIFLAIASAVNIVLDLVFVLIFSMGVAGVAVATIIAQAISWVFGILYINSKHPEINIYPFCFRFDRRIFKDIVKLGIPAAIQQALFSFSVMMMSRLINQFGSAFAAGYNAANKLDTFAFLPIQSIATAATTYTGQNIGAGRLDRVDSGIKASLKLSLSFSVLGLLVIPSGPLLMRLFSGDPEVIAAGMAFLLRIMPFYWLLAVLFVLNSVMRGAGSALVPMLSSVLSIWLARIPTAYLFAHYFGKENLNFSYAVGWSLGLMISIPYFLSGRWRNKAFTRAGSNPNPTESSSFGE